VVQLIIEEESYMSLYSNVVFIRCWYELDGQLNNKKEIIVSLMKDYVVIRGFVKNYWKYVIVN